MIVRLWNLDLELVTFFSDFCRSFWMIRAKQFVALKIRFVFSCVFFFSTIVHYLRVYLFIAFDSFSFSSSSFFVVRIIVTILRKFFCFYIFLLSFYHWIYQQWCIFQLNWRRPREIIFKKNPKNQSPSIIFFQWELLVTPSAPSRRINKLNVFLKKDRRMNMFLDRQVIDQDLG